MPTSVCAGDEDALHRGSQGRITPTLVTADAEIKLLTRAVRTVVSG